MNYSYPSFFFFPSANTVPNESYYFNTPTTWPIFTPSLQTSYQSFGNYVFPNNQIQPVPQFYDLNRTKNLQIPRNNLKLCSRLEEMGTELEIKKIKKDHPGKEGRKQVDANSQNCRRNVITNLGNQLLAFIGSKFKLSMLLLKVSSEITEPSINSLMTYIKRVKKEVKTYLSLDKMKQYWFESHGDQDLQELLILFRKVSYYYLVNYGRLQVTKSIKMKKQTKKYHLQGLRLLTSVLRRQFSRH